MYQSQQSKEQQIGMLYIIGVLIGSLLDNSQWICMVVSVADLRGVRRMQMHPPLADSNYSCVQNSTSPSNDYAAVACSNNNQAQFTRVSVPYWSPDVWLGLELLRDIQLGLPVILNNSLASYQSVATIITCVTNALIDRKWAWQSNNFQVLFVHP